jgi:hypothetical protein
LKQLKITEWLLDSKCGASRNTCCNLPQRHSCRLNRSHLRSWWLRWWRRRLELKLKWTHFSASKNNVMKHRQAIRHWKEQLKFTHRAFNLKNCQKNNGCSKDEAYHVLSGALWHLSHYSEWCALVHQNRDKWRCCKVPPFFLTSMRFVLNLQLFFFLFRYDFMLNFFPSISYYKIHIPHFYWIQEFVLIFCWIWDATVNWKILHKDRRTRFESCSIYNAPWLRSCSLYGW